MGKNAQFSVAIAVGIFGILAIFVSIATHKNMTARDLFWENACRQNPYGSGVLA
jgi:hypothetical protein